MSKKVMKKGAGHHKRGCEDQELECREVIRRRSARLNCDKSSNSFSNFEFEYSEGLDLCSKKLDDTYLLGAATAWRTVVVTETEKDSLLKQLGYNLKVVENITPDITNAKEICVLAAQTTGSFGRDFIIKYYKILKAEQSVANKNVMNDLADMFINMFSKENFNVEDMMQSDEEMMGQIGELKNQIEEELKENLEHMIQLKKKYTQSVRENIAKQIRKQKAKEAKEALIKKMHQKEQVNIFIEQINGNTEVVKKYFIDQYNLHKDIENYSNNDIIELNDEGLIPNVTEDNIANIDLQAFSRAYSDYLYLTIKEGESGLLRIMMGKLGLSDDSCPTIENPSSAYPFEAIRTGRFCSNPCGNYGGKSNKKPKSKKEAETNPKYVKTDRKCVCADKKQRTVYKRILKNGKESKADYVYLRKTKEYVPKW